MPETNNPELQELRERVNRAPCNAIACSALAQRLAEEDRPLEGVQVLAKCLGLLRENDGVVQALGEQMAEIAIAHADSRELMTALRDVIGRNAAAEIENFEEYLANVRYEARAGIASELLHAAASLAGDADAAV